MSKVKNHTKNEGSFAVVLNAQDKNLFYKKAILDYAKAKGLKISFDGMPKGDGKKIARGVDHAKPGNCLTFGTLAYCDVEWVERNSFVAEKGYIPVYDSINDYNKIVGDIDKLFDIRYGKTELSGGKYAKFDGSTAVIFDRYGRELCRLTDGDIDAIIEA